MIRVDPAGASADRWRRSTGEVQLEVDGPVTQRSVLDALEARYPMLRGTIRDHVTQQRRPFLRFFACEEDLSHESPDAPLPEAVANGKEPFLLVGAIAGDGCARHRTGPRATVHYGSVPPRTWSFRFLKVISYPSPSKPI